MSKNITLTLVIGCCLVHTTSVTAASATYILNMTGAQEVPGPGDADGSATGTISLDDTTGVLSWNFTYADIVAPSAMHIHGPGGSAGSGAGVHIGLGVTTSGGAGTLIDSLTHPTLADVSDVLSDPTDFYVNIHNADFGGGAVRGQLGVVPEPTSSALAFAALAGASLIRRRRRT